MMKKREGSPKEKAARRGQMGKTPLVTSGGEEREPPSITSAKGETALHVLLKSDALEARAGKSAPIAAKRLYYGSEEKKKRGEENTWGEARRPDAEESSSRGTAAGREIARRRKGKGAWHLASRRDRRQRAAASKLSKREKKRTASILGGECVSRSWGRGLSNPRGGGSLPARGQRSGTVRIKSRASEKKLPRIGEERLESEFQKEVHSTREGVTSSRAKKRKRGIAKPEARPLRNGRPKGLTGRKEGAATKRSRSCRTQKSIVR